MDNQQNLQLIFPGQLQQGQTSDEIAGQLSKADVKEGK